MFVLSSEISLREMWRIIYVGWLPLVRYYILRARSKDVLKLRRDNVYNFPAAIVFYLVGKIFVTAISKFFVTSPLSRDISGCPFAAVTPADPSILVRRRLNGKHAARLSRRARGLTFLKQRA